MKKLLQLLLIWFGISFYTTSLWVSNVEKFDIKTSPNEIKIWESTDITVEALDKDGNVVKNYEWEVLIFSQSDPKAEFPWILTQNTYKFQASDSGKVKFENGVKFTKAGTQDINVYETANENVFWVAEVKVLEGTTTSWAEEIIIKSPENGVTLWTWDIKVTGTTLKNHQIKILLNTDKQSDAISNGDGIFEYDLKWVPNWENFIIAQVLDSDGKVIWESTKTLFKIESNTPKFKSITINPEWEVKWNTLLNVSVEANNGLSNVEIVLNDLVQKLTEDSNGIYTGTITSPKDNWDYKIDVNLKNELGIESKQSGIATITVKNIELTAAPVVEPVTEIPVNCDDFKKELIIWNLKVVKMKSKSVLSWDKLEKATSYNLYKKDKNSWSMVLIQNLMDNNVEINIEWKEIIYDDFAVKAVLKNESCEIESTDFSSMTSVQTWPKEIYLLIFSLLFVWSIFFFRRKII